VPAIARSGTVSAQDRLTRVPNFCAQGFMDQSWAAAAGDEGKGLAPLTPRSRYGAYNGLIGVMPAMSSRRKPGSGCRQTARHAPL
jgi:hypothetical protein